MDPASRLVGFSATDAAGPRILGDVAADEMRRLATDLARFDAIFARLTGLPSGGGGPPLTVHLFRDHELAVAFGLGRGRAVWSFGTLDGSFIGVEVSPGRDESRNTLYHEYTHYLLARARRAPLPRWYHEGLACYFGTLSERGGAVVLGATPGTLAARVVSNGPLPLDRLFAASLDGMRLEEVADFYATSWALAHYLLSSPSGRRELAAFLRQLERGVPSGRRSGSRSVAPRTDSRRSS